MTYFRFLSLHLDYYSIIKYQYIISHISFSFIIIHQSINYHIIKLFISHQIHTINLYFIYHRIYSFIFYRNMEENTHMENSKQNKKRNPIFSKNDHSPVTKLTDSFMMIPSNNTINHTTSSIIPNTNRQSRI